MSTASDNLLHVGDAMPELAFPMLEDDSLSLADLHGKKYIVFMWASW